MESVILATFFHHCPLPIPHSPKAITFAYHHKVGRADNLWSVRINQDYRALAFKEGGDYYWFWIGSHKDYERLIK